MIYDDFPRLSPDIVEKMAKEYKVFLDKKIPTNKYEEIFNLLKKQLNNYYSIMSYQRFNRYFVDFNNLFKLTKKHYNTLHKMLMDVSISSNLNNQFNYKEYKAYINQIIFLELKILKALNNIKSKYIEEEKFNTIENIINERLNIIRELI